ncbi:MAG TPA: hypothetical protein VFI12_01260 [Thermomicrobiales bacterium]|jgi:hypothetical protein|nr:hypothetical protein [Thermomicrobiales bacterium]
MAFRKQPQAAADDEFVAESISPGCPMLIRAAAHHPTRPNALLMRCALGWSLHDELDYERCGATGAVQDCWRVHPERTPVVALPGSEDALDVKSRQHAAD